MLDLRTHRPEGLLDIGERYLSKQSGGWKWNGQDRWWNVFTTVTGFNGAGGYWIVEEWCWSTGGTHHRDICSLSAEDSLALDVEIERLKTERRWP